MKRRAYTNRGPNYKWRKSAVGRKALCALLHFVQSRVKEEDILDGARYAKNGVTEDTCYEFLKRAVPEVFEDCLEQTGREMPHDCPIKRVYVWFAAPPQRKTGRRVITSEHPFQWATPAMRAEGRDAFHAAG